MAVETAGLNFANYVFPFQQHLVMSIRGTKNYVFYMDQVLGAGSTGTVYFGRHKVGVEYCGPFIIN